MSAMSAETKAKIGAAHRGKVVSPETRAKLRAAFLGRKRSPEVVAAQSARQKGRPVSAASLAALDHARRNRIRTPEERAKIGAAGKGNSYVKSAVVKGECAYCFGPATAHDHVIPRGRPGWDAPDNLVLVCRWCNSQKGPRTPEEWFAGVRVHRMSPPPNR